MPDQIQLLVKSLKAFKNNLILVVPIFLSLGASFLLMTFVLLQVFLGALIFRSSNFYAGISLGFTAYAALFSFIDFIIYLLIVSYVSAAYYGTIADVVLKGNSSFRRLLQHGRTFLKPMLTFILARLAVTAAPLALLAIITFLAFMISSLAGYITAALSILLYILFLIAFSVITLFSTPMLVSRKLGGFRLIAEAFRYGKSNFKHAIITAAVAFVLGIISYILYSIFYIPSFIIRIASGEVAGAGAMLSLAIASYAFQILASIVLSICGIIIILYVFNSYFSRNPIKNWN